MYASFVSWLSWSLFMRTVFILFRSSQATKDPQSIVILVSLDGFRYDYLEKHKSSLPTLRHLAEQGTHVEYVQNVFPTVTFPNHYTIATGLYPESHGIVANNMYDPVYGAHFNMSTTESRWWESAEPIWVTNQKQGYRSGMCYWPGYDVEIRGQLPYYRPLNESLGKPFVGGLNLMPWSERVDMVVDWLNKTSGAPSFVTLYFEEPDEVGHHFGIDSLEMDNALKELDNVIRYMLEQLGKLDNFNQMNIIITGDHGMVNYNASTVISIDKYVNPESFVFWSPGGTAFLVTNSINITIDELYSNFKNAENGTNNKIKVFRKSETPEHLHFRNNRRIADIVGFVEAGFVMNTSQFRNWTMWKNITKGVHGYDSGVPEMHPFLIAYGPAFKQHYRSGPVQMVDIYSLVCYIIGIKPAPNNGSLSRIDHLLRSSSQASNVLGAEVAGIVIGSIIAVVTCLLLIYKLRGRFRGKGPSILFRNQRSEWDYPLMGSEGEEDEIEVIF